jgi:hypothetical protein
MVRRPGFERPSPSLHQTIAAEAEARKTIGANIKTVQQTWPIGKRLREALEEDPPG